MLLVISLASSVVAGAQFRPDTFPWYVPDAARLRAVAILGFAIGGPILTLLGLTLWTGLVQLASKMLGGKAPYSGLFCGLVFAQIPSAFGIPINAAGAYMGSVGNGVATLVGIGLAVWTLVLFVIAIRENSGFGTGGAVGALLLPIAFLVVLFGIIGVLFALLAMSFAGLTQ